jgi:hypothetical protein
MSKCRIIASGNNKCIVLATGVLKIRMNIRATEEKTPLAFQVIPYASNTTNSVKVAETEINLETTMQSLGLSRRHPISLELAGTRSMRSFIVRATTDVAIQHAKAQLQALYPQLELRPLVGSEDPLRLEENEEVQVIELLSGAESYLPLHTGQESKQNKQGKQEPGDPVIGILAALSDIPEGTRVIAQVGMVPAAPDWSKKYLRKAIEPALDPEKRLHRAEGNLNRMGYLYQGNLLAGAGVAILLCFAFLQSFLPAKVKIALFSLQNIPLLTGMILGCAVSVMALMLLTWFIWQKIFPKPIYDMELVRQKALRMAYHVRLRLYAISSVPGEQAVDRDTGSFWQWNQESRQRKKQLRNHLLRLVAAYRQYHLAGGAYFRVRYLSSAFARRLLNPRRKKFGSGWQQGIKRSPHLLSVDDLAALWHLPLATRLTDLALVQKRQARSLQIPPDLAPLFETFPAAGYSEHGGYRLPFAFIPQFFSVHTLIGGKSGEGKSTAIELIAREAMEESGLVLIDPHGDLCDHLLSQVPLERMDDVVVIDLADPDTVIGLNPLDVTLGRSRDKTVADLIKTFSHIWPEAWGPRMENAFEMALRTLFEANRVLVERHPYDGAAMQYTLLDVISVLTNEGFTDTLLQEITDDYLPRWWKEYLFPMSPAQQRDVIVPVLSKAAKFESMLARRIVGQSVSTLNLSDIIAERKILLVKLAKGVVGADIAALVGATLLNLLQVALEEQGNSAEAKRVRLPIILDEFQTLPGVDYAALAELRKYGATFILATQSLQYLDKLDPVLLPTVLANVRQMVIFHMSAEDAEALAPELGIAPEDILSLDPHMCYIKMPTASQRHPVFSVKLIPPQLGDPRLAERIRAHSQALYTRQIEEVDEMLHLGMGHKKQLLASVSERKLVVNEANYRRRANLKTSQARPLLQSPQNKPALLPDQGQTRVPSAFERQEVAVQSSIDVGSLQTDVRETQSQQKREEIVSDQHASVVEIQILHQVDQFQPANELSPSNAPIIVEENRAEAKKHLENEASPPENEVVQPNKKKRRGSRGSGKTKKNRPVEEMAENSPSESGIV